MQIPHCVRDDTWRLLGLHAESHTPGKLLRSRLTFDSTAAVSEWRRGEWRGGGRLEEEDGVAVDFKTHGFGDLAAAYDVAEGGVELVFFVFR